MRYSFIVVVKIYCFSVFQHDLFGAILRVLSCFLFKLLCPLASSEHNFCCCSYKAWGSLLGQQLSERDIIVACIDYRNFPQGTISDMVKDASQGISFVCNSISEYGGDPNRQSTSLSFFILKISNYYPFLAKFSVIGSRFFIEFT